LSFIKRFLLPKSKSYLNI